MPAKKPSKPRKPSISIIGAGRLGTALALKLRSSGYDVQALVARRASHARLAAQAVSASEALDSDELEKLPRSSLIIVSTPDDVIASTAQRLAQVTGFPKGTTVMHTSGALSSSLLSPLAAKGFHTGSIHPLVSVSDWRTGADGLNGAYYCIEGDAKALKLARALVRDLRGHAFSIRSDKKALYHAAAVMSSGHLVALLDITRELLVECGLSEKEARRVLEPLVISTVAGLGVSDSARALTGTYARGDVRTAEEHLKALDQDQLREARAVYKLLGQRSIQIGADRGLDPAVLEQLRVALQK